MKAFLLATGAACLFLSGCASQVISSRPLQSYQVGQRLAAPVGGPLLRIEKGSRNTVKKWVGILNAADGWAYETSYSEDYVKGELVYGGISGKTIEISYREFRGNYAAPAFFQSLKYDLSESSYITFQNFRINVTSASNSGIEGVLMSDGSR